MIHMTEEQYAESMRNVRKAERREKLIAGIISHVKPVIFIPVSIGLGAISFIARMVGSIASIGLFYGVFKIYEVFKQLKAGIAFAEVSGIAEVLFFVGMPFILMGLSELLDSISIYLKRNAY